MQDIIPNGLTQPPGKGIFSLNLFNFNFLLGQWCGKEFLEWCSTQVVSWKGTKGKPPTTADRDDRIDKLDAAKLRKLRPVFKDAGSVTAGNSSSISDGAAGLVLASGAKARALGLHVIAKL